MLELADKISNFENKKEIDFPFSIFHDDFIIYNNVFYFNEYDISKEIGKVSALINRDYENVYTSFSESKINYRKRSFIIPFNYVPLDKKDDKSLLNFNMRFLNNSLIEYNHNFNYSFFWVMLDLASLSENFYSNLVLNFKKNILFYVYSMQGSLIVSKIANEEKELRSFKKNKMNSYLNILVENEFNKFCYQNMTKIGIKELFNIVDFIKEKKKYMYFGVVECIDFPVNIDTKESIIEYISSRFDDYEEESSIDLQDEILIDLGIDSCTITHLNNKLKLETEGSRLRHCVGGYTYKVKNNYSLIFSIEYNEERSTLEVGFEKDNFVLKQHRSKFNRIPSDSLNKISNDVIFKLNQSNNSIEMRSIDKTEEMFVFFEGMLD
jgi:hypothetical protein